MKKFSLLFVFCFLTCLFANAQSVGIGTNLPHPTAQLHVDVGSTSNGFLVSGLYNASTVPDLGGGSRMMFYPGKCAFRAGYAGSTQWNNANVGPFSVAFGYSTTAFGMESTAFGASTIANAQFSTAFGSGTLATGVASTAFGTATSASANSSTAMGSGTSAGGDYSTSMGYNT